MRTNYTLRLKGFVGGYDFDRSYVDYVLDQNKDKPVTVLIDSLGGYLHSALSISSAFRNHGDVSVHFVGMNASAATIASLGAKHISMDSSAMYLAHKCSSAFCEWADMNSDQMQDLIDRAQKAKTDLDKLDANVASMYAAKCKKDKKALLELMKVGGWLTSEEALAWGFVDEITDLDDDEAPVLTDTVASAMASAGIPIPDIRMADSNSAFSKFLNAVASVFKHRDFTNSTISVMNKVFKSICSLLAVKHLSVVDGNVSLPENQVQAIEDYLNEKDTAINDLNEKIKVLNAQIEELKKNPAEQTSNVFENSKSKQEDNLGVVESYVDTFNSATDLFNNLP